MSTLPNQALYQSDWRQSFGRVVGILELGVPAAEGVERLFNKSKDDITYNLVRFGPEGADPLYDVTPQNRGGEIINTARIGALVIITDDVGFGRRVYVFGEEAVNNQCPHAVVTEIFRNGTSAASMPGQRLFLVDPTQITYGIDVKCIGETLHFDNVIPSTRTTRDVNIDTAVVGQSVGVSFVEDEMGVGGWVFDILEQVRFDDCPVNASAATLIAGQAAEGGA